MKFTGEYCILDQVSKRIQRDHLERYRFACQIAKSKTVLDIACGSGYSAKMFLKSGVKSYLGVDINPDLIESARNNNPGYNISFESGSVCNYIGSGQRFDLITCFETIEHIVDYSMAINNFKNLLSKDGILLISSPNRPLVSPSSSSIADKPLNPHHTQEFTPEELTEVIKNCGFSIKKKYGQRQELMANTRLGWKILNFIRFFRPTKDYASPVVKPLKGRIPRYFILWVTLE